ncbi:MAG: hypothetical protein KF729_26825 [Sandaracinaceae bacterium]|nr:hypothetical protein [Sandaracinaceae bacterium]
MSSSVVGNRTVELLAVLLGSIAGVGCYLAHSPVPAADPPACGSTPPAPAAPIDSLLVVADGALLELGGDGSIRRVANADPADDVLGSPDGRSVVLSRGDSITVVDVDSGRPIAQLPPAGGLEGCDASGTEPRWDAAGFSANYRADGRVLGVTCFVNEMGTVTRRRMRTHLVEMTYGGFFALSSECSAGFFRPGSCLEFRLDEMCPTNWHETPRARGAVWSVHDPVTGEEVDRSFILPDELPLAVLRDGAILVHARVDEGGYVGLLDITRRQRRELSSLRGARWADVSRAGDDGYVVVRQDEADVLTLAASRRSTEPPREASLPCSPARDSFWGPWRSSPDGSRLLLPCDGPTGVMLVLYDLHGMTPLAHVPTETGIARGSVRWRADSGGALIIYGSAREYHSRTIDRDGHETTSAALAATPPDGLHSIAWRIDERLQITP